MRKILAIAALVLMAACGGETRTTGLTGATTGSPTPTASASSGVSASLKPSPGSGITGVDIKSSPTATSTAQASGKATITPACVRSGSGDPVKLIVETVPGASVGYSTEYSDNSNELTNRSYATGFGSGVAASNGVYEAAWIVPATAPAGPAVVHLVSSVGHVQSTVSFTIVATTGRCP